MGVREVKPLFNDNVEHVGTRFVFVSFCFWDQKMRVLFKYVFFHVRNF